MTDDISRIQEMLWHNRYGKGRDNDELYEEIERAIQKARADTAREIIKIMNNVHELWGCGTSRYNKEPCDKDNCMNEDIKEKIKATFLNHASNGSDRPDSIDVNSSSTTEPADTWTESNRQYITKAQVEQAIDEMIKFIIGEEPSEWYEGSFYTLEKLKEKLGISDEVGK